MKKLRFGLFAALLAIVAILNAKPSAAGFVNVHFTISGVGVGNANLVADSRIIAPWSFRWGYRLPGSASFDMEIDFGGGAFSFSKEDLKYPYYYINNWGNDSFGVNNFAVYLDNGIVRLEGPPKFSSSYATYPGGFGPLYFDIESITPTETVPLPPTLFLLGATVAACAGMSLRSKRQSTKA